VYYAATIFHPFYKHYCERNWVKIPAWLATNNAAPQKLSVENYARWDRQNGMTVGRLSGSWSGHFSDINVITSLNRSLYPAGLRCRPKMISQHLGVK
jgi:hypothetical protein